MNPNTTLRLWLLAAGKQFGIRNAYDYRCTDDESRIAEPYCTYKLLSYDFLQNGYQDLTTKTNNTATRSAYQVWNLKTQIDLYNSQDGLHELAAMCVALDSDPNIRAIFDDDAAFINCESINNLTNFEDDKINYHMQAICNFNVNVEFALEESNAVVDEIKITLESGNYEWTIDGSGYQ